MDDRTVGAIILYAEDHMLKSWNSQYVHSWFKKKKKSSNNLRHHPCSLNPPGNSPVNIHSYLSQQVNQRDKLPLNMAIKCSKFFKKRKGRGKELNSRSMGWEEVNGKLSLMGRCGFAYFGLGNLWYHLGEEDKPLWGPVECRTCNYVETGTTSAALAKITSIMSVETQRNLKLLGGCQESVTVK